MIFFNSRKHFRFGISPFGKRFEGYSFTDLPNGRSRNTYTGEYYSKKLTDSAALKRRILSYVLSLLGIVLMIIAAIPSSSVNKSTLIGLCITLTLLLTFWMIYILVIMALDKNHLTLWAFRVTALQFILVSAVLCIISFISSVFTLVYIILIDTSSLNIDIPGLIMRMASFLAFLTITLLEYNTEYDVQYPA